MWKLAVGWHRTAGRRCSIQLLGNHARASSSSSSNIVVDRRREFSSSSSGSSDTTTTLPSPPPSLKEILDQVSKSQITADQALQAITAETSTTMSPAVNNEDKDTQRLQSFARIDHERSHRTGFPEVVFAEGKTAEQVCAILDDMAQHVLAAATQQQEQEDDSDSLLTAILATRVSPEQYEEMLTLPLTHGTLSYDSVARVATMTPTGMEKTTTTTTTTNNNNNTPKPRVVVASAGTTDIPVCEEAAVTLEAAGCEVDRVYDAGVAGLHRIINATPRLRDPAVRCVIVCAGMDGALPSVVGGLVNTPVIAVPTSVGYGASFGGVSALLTMLNTCSPGVGVVNIDNGFGAAAMAFKMIYSSRVAAAAAAQAEASGSSA